MRPNRGCFPQVLLLVLVLSIVGCSHLGDIAKVIGELDDVEDWIEDLKEEDVKDPSPAPDPGPGCSFPEAVWHGDVTDKTSFTGLVVCTGNYVSEYIGASGGGSIAFCSATFTRTDGYVWAIDHKGFEPRNIIRDATQPHAAAPGNAHNWTIYGDNPPAEKWYIYTTSAPGKEAHCDGTRRGYLWVPFNAPGSWTVQLRWRSCDWRGTAYYGLVTEKDGRRHMALWRHDQSGDGETYDCTLGSGFVFCGDSQ